MAIRNSEQATKSGYQRYCRRHMQIREGETVTILQYNAIAFKVGEKRAYNVGLFLRQRFESYRVLIGISVIGSVKTASFVHMHLFCDSRGRVLKVFPYLSSLESLEQSAK